MFRLASIFFLAVTMLASASLGQKPSAAVLSEIAPSGTLRVAINYGNALLAQRDAVTGELSGVSVDLTNELGKRLGVPVKLVPYEAAGKVTAAVKAGEWDVAYLAIDPARAVDIQFSPAYLKLEGTYMVPAGSPLHAIEDMDKPGIRIVVAGGSAYDLYLSRTLKSAQLIRVTTTPEAIDMMVSAKLDAVAAIRTALKIGSRRVPGAIVMTNSFMIIPQAMGVPQGRPAAAAYVAAFIEEMKRSGFIADVMKRHGLENEADLVPAMK